MEIKRRKERVRKPLYLRTFAIVMAVVMVLSVVYISHRNDKVKADEPLSVSTTDATYLDQIGEKIDLGKGLSDNTFTVNVPATGIAFTLPDASGYNSSEITKEIEVWKVTVAADSSVVYRLTEPADGEYEDAVIDKISAVKYYTRTAEWVGATEGKLTSAAESVSATLKVTDTFVKCLSSEEGNPDISASLSIPATEVIEVAKITLSSYGISDITSSVDNSAKSASFADPDGSKADEGNTYYYGNISYALTKDGTSVVTGKLSEVNSAVVADKTPAGDGEYVVTKTVSLADTAAIENKVISNSKTATLNRNFYVINDSSVRVFIDGAPAGVISGSTANGNKTIEIPGGSAKQNPKKDIVVSFSTDKDITPTVTGESTISVSGDKSEYSFTIPGTVDNNGEDHSYTLTAVDGDATDTISITVNYGDGTPVLSKGTIGGKEADTRAVKDATTSIGITAETGAGSGAIITNADLYKVSSATADISGTPLSNETLSTTPATAEFKDVTLNAGNNYFKVQVESDYGIKTVSDAFTVFYDDADPALKKATVKQTGYGSYGGSNLSPEGGIVTVPNAITCMKDASIVISAEDLQSDNSSDGSGIQSVTINGAEASLSEGLYSYTLPADTTKTSGGSADIPVVVTDEAGRTSEYTIKVKYFNEAINISQSYTPSGATEEKFFIWDGGSKKGTLEYTVVSDVELDEANTTVSISIDGAAPSVSTLTKKSESVTDGKYNYVFKYDFDDTVSAKYVIDFTATNINGYQKSADQQIRNVDITDPDKAGVETVDNVWHSSLTINVTVSDQGVSSGISTVEATGTEQSSYTPDASGKFSAKVNDSATSAGTTVTFKVKDKAGNVSEQYSAVYLVDGQAPTATLTIDGKDAETVSGVLSSDPKIEFSATEAGASGFADDGINLTISDGSTTKTITDLTLTGKKFSELFGAKLDAAKEYTVTFTVKDKAGNSDTKTTTFKVDDSDPVVTGAIENTPVKSEFPTDFKENVTVNVTITDSNLKQSNIEITGTGSENVNAEWTKTSTGYTGILTATTEGVYALTVKATDDGGRTGSWKVSFTIDKTIPVLNTMINNAAYTGGAGFYNSPITTSVGVSDANEDTSDVNVAITRTAFDGTQVTETAKGKGPYELSEEGVYTITYTVRDKAGNEASASIGATMDKTSPVAKINIATKYPKMPGYYNTDSVDMTIEITDPTVLPANVSVTDNGKSVAVSWASSGGKTTGTYSTSSEEKHVIAVTARDLSGNTATTAETFMIDRTKPKLTTRVNSKEYTDKDKYFSTNTFSNVVVQDKNQDDDDISVTVRYSGYDGNESVETKQGTGPFKFTKQGKYELVYKAVDKAGNERIKTIGFYLDKSKPLGNMYIKTDKPDKFKQFNATYKNKLGKFKARKDQEVYTYGQYYKNNVSIEFNYFDYDIDQVTITDGDEELIPDWTEKNGYGKGSVSVTGEGHHVIKMILEDKSGNITRYVSGQKILDFYIDKTPPQVVTSVNGSAATDGSGVSMNSSGTVGVSVVDTYKDPDDLTRTAKITAPGGGTTVNSAKVQEGSESFANEADYEIEYVAVDKAGNESQPKSVQFRVDRTAPQLSITSDAKNGASTTAVDVTFNIKEPFYNDMSSSKIEVYKKVDGARESHVKTIDFMPKSSNDTKTDKYEDDGEYRFVFSAADKAGNQASETYTFILDGSKPVITLSGVKNYDKTEKDVELGIQVDETFYMSNKVTLSGTKTDINGTSSDIKFEEFPTTSAKIANLKQMFKEDGVYDITVSSVDKAGNKDTKTIHFTIDTKPPVIEPLDQYDGTKVSEFKLEKSLDELVTDLTVCDVKLYMDGVEYDGVSELSDGTHVFRIEATDEMGHKSEKEFTFVLDTIAPNIIVTGAEDGAYLKEATLVEVSVEVDDDYLDYVTVNGEAVVVSDNKCQVNVDKRGKYHLEAAASDGAGNKSSITMDFHYGNRFIWLILGGAVILVGAIAAFLIAAAKRRRDD